MEAPEPPAYPVPDASEAQRYKSAGRGVSLVIQRCEKAKETGTLDLKACELVSLPDAIYLILKDYDIKQLSLAHNKLKSFPKRIPEKFFKLQVLSLQGNLITQLPKELPPFQKLKALDLAGNALTHIPDFLFAQPHLRIINLANNRIEGVELGDAFVQAEKLQILNLAGNPLSDEARDHIAASPHKEKVKLE